MLSHAKIFRDREKTEDLVMKASLETRCIHGDGYRYCEETRAISFPIYQTASFSHVGIGHNGSGFDYTRESNPTREHLEETVTSLENASDTVAFSSGMAAINTFFELFRPGDGIICSEDLYGGTVRLFKNIAEKNGLDISYADTSDMEAVKAAWKDNTRALYIESPSNPMMEITDIRACSSYAHEKGSLLAVDNTFLSPYWQNPLDLGADFVLHSGTKFLAGHNDTVAGFLSSASPEWGEMIRLTAKTIGNTLSPFDSWLVMRGIKTLAVRMERSQETSFKLAGWLKTQPWVESIRYIGLKEHPGHEVQKNQSRGFGSMISFSVKDKAVLLRILKNVRIITFAESLGGTETLITYPQVQTHADVPEAVRERLGINDRLLRLSVGLERAEDLIADLKQASERMA